MNAFGSSEAIRLISSFFSFLPHLVTLAACIYYVSKVKSIDAYLMLIGSIIGIILSTAYQIVPMMNSSFESISTIYMVLGGVGFISGTLFTVGFFMAIVKFVKARNVSN